MEDMEDAEKTKLEELLMCPVCQDVFKDPRQLPCGHSMCLACLQTLMDHSSDVPFRCPDCRTHFGPIVGVHRSFALEYMDQRFDALKEQIGESFESVKKLQEDLKHEVSFVHLI
uniref:RING-type domain-containing protein n=1 Tax=Gasterosteus aculeatus aculeatus TaxID=481459 RepID=A0AAQ4QT82_GASAC